MISKKAVRESVYFLIRITGLPLLVRNLLQRNTVTILTFHNLEYHTAFRLFRFIKRKYNPIPLRKYRDCLEGRYQKLPPMALVVTLDDGYKENYNLLGLLKETGIVPTIFLCSDMVDTDNNYWFRTVGDHETVSSLKRMNNSDRISHVAQLKQEKKNPPERVVLNRKEIEEMKPFVEFQAHTCSHPVLTQCTDGEAIQEIAACRKTLVEKFGLDIYSLAYPNGSFGEREARMLNESGYSIGLGLNAGNNTLHTNPFALYRIPLNDNAGMNEIIVKSTGIYDFLIKRLLPFRRYR